MMEENNIPFGIDLGCTKTCGAVWRNEKIEVILNELGSPTTPSYYYFDGNESCVGKSAKDKTGTNPKNVYYDSKQILAQKATDPLIKKFKTQWTFDLKGNRAKGNICEYIVNEQTEPLSPIVVSGEILKSIKKSAEKQCSQKLTKAVITVPAYFSTEQKKATQEAAKYANLDVISIITEPTAAAIAYGLEQHKYKDGEKLFVFDLGGGTFDVTIMSISKNCFTNLVVRGDFNLGGRDFDHLIFEWIKQKLAAEGMDVKNLNQKKKFKMMLQAQAVKEALTFSQEKLVILSDIFETAKSHMLKRSEFEAMSKTLLKKLETECQAALQSKNLKPRDIDHVLFVGGSSRMPMVAKMLKNIFLDETKFAKVVNPDEVVAVGAAMYAAACLKASKRPEIVGMNIVLVLPMNIGVEILASESAENLERFKLYPTRPAIGIHLGTTNSCVGYFVNNNVEIVTSPSGKRTVPSYVFYDENEGCIIGEQAIARLKTNPNHVVYDSKRMIGLNYDDNVVNRNKSFWTFTVTKDDNNRPIYDIDKKHQALPEEVSSEILKELVKMVQDKTWIKKINAAVITVPDHFLVGQKEATIHAAKLAGIENVVLITEPTAVAFAYGFDHKRFDGYNLFIFRLGGKTCDVSIVKVEKGEFKVIGHAGDTQLGGRDFDSCLVHYFDEKYRELCVFHGDNEIITKRRIRLREACENFKIAVSLPGKHSETIHFNDISPDLSAEDLTYKEYKEIVADITRRCRKLCFDTLEETQLTADDIDEILLAGGSTKMRVIKDMLKGIFQKRELSEAISPDEVFAYGATLRAAQFLDPEKSKTFCNSLTLPNGIGVSLVGNRIHNLFKRNTPFSTKFGPETYSTVYNNQTVMNFYIYQGERLSTDKNDFIMDVELEGLPKKRAEEVKATLELELDAHGSLTAVARGGGKEVTKQVNYKEQIMQKGNNLCNAPSNSSNIKLCASVDEKNVNLEKFLNRHYGHGISAFHQTMNNIVLVNLNCRSIPFLINAFQTYYTFIYDNVNNKIPDLNKSSLSDSITPTNWFTLSKHLGTKKILDKKNIAVPYNLSTFVTNSHNNFLITSVIDISYFPAANSMCSAINWIQKVKQVDAICSVVEINGESNYEKAIIRHLSYFSNKDLEKIVLFVIHKASSVIPIATITLRITDAIVEYYKERKAVFKNGYDNIFIFDNDAYKHLLDEPKSLQDMDERLLKTWYHTVFEFLRFLKRPAVKQKHFVIVEDL